MTDDKVTGDSGRPPDAQRLPEGIAASGLLMYESLLPAFPGSVSRIRSELTSVLERNGVAADRCDEIALVFSEAATNAVLYAYPDTSSGPLYVAGTLEGDTVTVSVCDSGRGLTLGADRSGLGAGLTVMLRLVDHLEISSVDGTCVHATFDHATTALAVGAHRDSSAEAGRHRGDMLREYVRVLISAHLGLGEDTQAVLAQAHHALRQSRRSRRSRQQRSRQH